MCKNTNFYLLLQILLQHFFQTAFFCFFIIVFIVKNATTIRNNAMMTIFIYSEYSSIFD